MVDPLRTANADALVIGSGMRAVAHLAARWLDSPFPVLYDADRSVYRAYGLEKRAGLVQRSGTFVVGPDGVIRYAHTALNPFDAMDWADWAEIARAIGVPEGQGTADDA